MRLRRPYIPLAVRLQVAERQGAERFRDWLLLKISGGCPASPPSERLRWMLAILFDPRAAPPELHHRPALCNRPRKRNGDYDPPANDPDHLVYLAEHDHAIETRVRGVGAQRSDLGQRRYLKRVKRNRDKQRPRRRWPKRRRIR